MSVTWSWDLEAYISAAWVSIKRDVEVFKTPTVAARGIDGSDITNRVASPGSLSCSLDNGQSNSAGLLGYYSPAHTNFRANFGRKTLVRLKFTYSGTDYYLWRGYITDLVPSIGQFKERSSSLSATDYMQRLAEYKINLLPVQEDQRSDEIIQTILNSLPTAPVNTSLSTDKFTLPFALSSDMDEKTTAMSAIQKICQTVLGYVFITGNTTDGETLVFQREEDRAKTASAATLDNTMSEMKPSRSTDMIKNRLVGKVHPVRVDEDPDTLLYELENDIQIPGGETKTFTFRFKDPQNQSARISAKDVVTPLVENVNFRASKFENTTLDDANADLTITDTNGGNSAKWVVENTIGNTVFFNMINIFGSGIFYYNPVDIVVESGDADKEESYDFYYLSDTNKAEGFLHRLHERKSSEEPDIESVSFYADANATLMGYAMTLDIGDRVTCIEESSGINGQYIINKVTYTIETSGALKCDWGLEPADPNSYFILASDADESLLDGSDLLSPY